MDPRADRALTTWLARLYPFQRQWANERTRFALTVKARQIGFSHATAAGAVLGALVLGRPQVILSASQDQSDEVLEKAKAHARVLAALGYPGAGQVSTDSATELGWDGGGRIIALPANPRTARGYSGDLWLDEFAYHADARKIRDAAFPVAMRGDWRIRVLSTPNGAQGLFYDLAQRTSAGWSRTQTTIEDARADGLAIDESALRELAGDDERLFDQWFRCAFLDGDLQYYPSGWLERARGEHAIPDLADPAVSIHAGLDIGRTHDLTVLAVVALCRGVAHVLAVLTARRTRFAAQRAMVERARDALRWDSLHVDASGLGTQLAEELREQWGEEEVHAVQFTAPAKEALFTGAFRWLAANRLRIPADDAGEALVREGRSIRRVISRAGQVSYRAASTDDGHADRWTALCLALSGAGDPPSTRGVSRAPLYAVA